MIIVRLLTILLALSVLPATANENTTQVAADSIVQYEAEGGGMLANANVDWNKYTKVLLDRATVEFREDWVKNQQRLNKNIVPERDLAQIRSWISDMLQEALNRKNADTEG